MKRPKRLTASFVRTIKEPGRYGDGHGGYGLSLLVKPRKAGGYSKTWSQRVILNSKPVNIGLGAFPIVNLAEAREKALGNRRKIAQGKDPREKPRLAPTFAQAAEKVISIHARGWKKGGKSETQWRLSMRNHVLPHLGERPVSVIQPKEVMNVLLPIWNTKPETARRVRQRIGAVMKWAVAQGFRNDNPAGDVIGAALPKHTNTQVHYRALPFAQVPGALRKLRNSSADRSSVLCMEFLTLCAARSGEARLAHWSEIDLDLAIWRIPAQRMKGGREHRVPLSSRALLVLSEARKLEGSSGIVFPSARGRCLSHGRLSTLCQRLELDCVPHGMRSSFRDWCAECTDAPREVCEIALAHVNSNRVERAYRRTDLFERRRQLMEDWANYLTGSKRDG